MASSPAAPTGIASASAARRARSAAPGPRRRPTPCRPPCASPCRLPALRGRLFHRLPASRRGGPRLRLPLRRLHLRVSRPERRRAAAARSRRRRDLHDRRLSQPLCALQARAASFRPRTPRTRSCRATTTTRSTTTGPAPPARRTARSFSGRRAARVFRAAQADGPPCLVREHAGAQGRRCRADRRSPPIAACAMATLAADPRSRHTPIPRRPALRRRRQGGLPRRRQSAGAGPGRRAGALAVRRFGAVATRLERPRPAGAGDAARPGPGGRRRRRSPWTSGTPIRRRATVCSTMSSRREVKGLVVLTGDVHNAWVADLKADFLNPASATLGTEFISSSMATPATASTSTRCARTRSTATRTSSTSTTAAATTPRGDQGPHDRGCSCRGLRNAA